MRNHEQNTYQALKLLNTKKSVKSVQLFKFHDLQEHGLIARLQDLNNNNEIRTLRFFGIYMSYTEVIRFAKVIINKTAIHTIEFEFINLNSSQVPTLLSMFESNKNITCLKLEELHITSLAVIKLTEALSENTSITNLSLRNNGIVSNNAIDIGKMIFKNPRIKVLKLGKNNLGDHGVDDIFNIIGSNNSLISLDISDNLLTKFYYVRDTSKLSIDTIDNYLTLLKNIVKLNLSNNLIFSSLAINSFIKALRNNQSLKILNYSRNHLISEQTSDLIQNILRQEKIISLNLKGNNLNARKLHAIILLIFKNSRILNIDLGLIKTHNNPFYLFIKDKTFKESSINHTLQKVNLDLSNDFNSQNLANVIHKIFQNYFLLQELSLNIYKYRKGKAVQCQQIIDRTINYKGKKYNELFERIIKIIEFENRINSFKSSDQFNVTLPLSPAFNPSIIVALQYAAVAKIHELEWKSFMNWQITGNLICYNEILKKLNCQKRSFPYLIYGICKEASTFLNSNFKYLCWEPIMEIFSYLPPFNFEGLKPKREIDYNVGSSSLGR